MNWAIYLIQVNIYLILFYGFYTLLLRSETFFILNRIYLVSTAILSLCIPIIQSQWVYALFFHQQDTVSVTLESIYLTGVTVTQSKNLTDWLLIIYLSGALISTGKFAHHLYLIIKSQGNSPQSAWSFFSKIRISDELDEKESIRKHEMVHANQLHSADVILFEILAIINWFNPISYLYIKSIKYIHEFIADENTADIMGKHDYSVLLVSNAFGVKPLHLTNSFFNQSLLKKRIIMLQKNKSKRTALLKYGLSAPLFACMVVMASASSQSDKLTKQIKNTVDNVNAELANNTAGPSGSVSNLLATLINAKPIATPRNTLLRSTDSVFSVTTIDKLPEFQGGMYAFFAYVGKNYKYPVEARKKGITGKLILSFIIETDGTLTDIKILQDIGYGTGEEALKLLQNCPKWQPGIKDKKPVRVLFTLPIMLNLEGDKTGSINSNSQIDSNQPLYLLDGKEIKQSDIAAIDANTIKSIHVAKGNQTAQYGEKGKYGVIKLQLKTPEELAQTPSDSSPVKELKSNINELSPTVVVGYNASTTKEISNSIPNFKGLIIVDGKETSSSDLKNIKQETIQSMSVLNDDQASKMYGAKGKNGAIIVTSKK
ncbi:TonB family protein [Arcticibacter eurypsychrophilus]|uniref:TonB family protein n=1 Tax=Arcticibacter eurypsychrophilus TaxID=1434752 RepID=UPI00084DD8E5|nr:TonB family protein [Arcticibacter eurypsychrophilus]